MKNNLIADVPLYILAGGKASRLGDLAKSTPKYLQKITKDKCFADYHLERVKNWGFTKLCFCLGHLGEPIQRYLKDKTKDFEIEIYFDGDDSLGTGGAVYEAWKSRKDKMFALTYGDTLLDFDVNEFWRDFIESNKYVSMTVLNSDKAPEHACNVEIDSKNVFYSKHKKLNAAKFIDYGFLAFRESAMNEFSQDRPLDLGVPLESLSKAREINAFEVSVAFKEIGTTESLKKFQNSV